VHSQTVDQSDFLHHTEGVPERNLVIPVVSQDIRLTPPTTR